ncbi:MAG: UbiA family prenyltransferase [Candidatus Moranbacteria bacterium]|nr:UbiA family prenyltransferase [Candidatus Moranbacteria bacterium]
MEPRQTARRLLKKSLRATKSFVATIEDAQLSPTLFIATFLAIVISRILIETVLSGFAPRSDSSFFLLFAHYFLEFLFTLLLLIPIVRRAGSVTLRAAANVSLLAFLLVLTPPITDAIISGGAALLSTYEVGSLTELFRSFIGFFDSTPDSGITYGIRLEVALSAVGIAGYTLIRSRKRGPLRALAAAVATYSVLFVVSTLPAWIAILFLGPSKGFLSVTGADAIGMFFSPRQLFSLPVPSLFDATHVTMILVYSVLLPVVVAAILFRFERTYFLALLKNVRWPQVLWHGGLLFLGGTLAIVYAGADQSFSPFELIATAVMSIAVVCAWLASVVANDLADRRIDEVTNAKRPLPTRDIPAALYREIGVFFFAGSILLSLSVSSKAALLILAYQGIAWIYSVPPLRLKRIPVIATLLSAAAGMTILFAGYEFASPIASISPIPSSLLVYLFICYAVTIPLKDFKDMEGDRKDGVITIPVLLGEERARFLVGILLFFCYAVSPIALHDAGLFVPAFLFASLSFLSVRRANRPGSRWGSFRSLPAWNMFFIILYGCITAVFLLN